MDQGAACNICQRIEHIRTGRNPDFIVELPGGYLVLGDHQFFKGYVVFLAKTHVLELHELPPAERAAFLHDLPLIGQAAWNTFAPRKLNYEILGNTDPHLHAHIFPRYADDPNPDGPVWVIPKEVRKAESSRLDAQARMELMQRIKTGIELLRH